MPTVHTCRLTSVLALGATTEALIELGPEQTARVLWISMTNTSGSTATCRLYLNGTGTGQRWLTQSVPSASSVFLNTVFVMQPNDVLYGDGSGIKLYMAGALLLGPNVLDEL